MKAIHPFLRLTPFRLTPFPLAQLNGNRLPDDLLDEFNIQKLLVALLAIGVAAGLLAGLEWLINWSAERTPRRFRLIIKQSLPFWKALILFSTGGYVLNLFLIFSPNNIFALTGTVAVALGFAFKDYVSSVIAGILALFETPYRVGDRVNIGGHYGEVTHYGLRGIKLRTPNDDTVTVPHNLLWTEAVVNTNDGALEAQVSVDFFFGHTVNAEAVRRILMHAAYTSPYTQLNLPIAVVITTKLWGFAFKLRCYPIDARDEFTYRTDLILRVKAALDQDPQPYPHLLSQR
ncbi:MAG: mechanosensitive ion channel family protein [Synechococcaceae cyanobacterium SM2_3_2]|nr:mechanosensitive ion channel family protein [Synechococcaceae cyanobacterium SM2_3_2]